MTRRKKTIGIVVATLLILAATVIAFFQFGSIRDPEVSNVGDRDGVEGDTSNDVEGEFPSFFVSDPRLRIRTEYAISSTLVDKNQAGVPDAPFFIQLADGRWAAGRTNEAGKTPPIFTAQEEKYQAYYDDEAVERWHKNRPSRRSP